MKRMAWMSLLALLLPLAAFPAEEPAVQPAASAPGLVFTIPIHGMIEPALIYVIRRGVNEAQAANAKAIIFIMDTPGGTVDAASEIVRLIQKVPVPTYTFVENDAFSAGAIIALATRHIYMAPGSKIGDAMPIMMTPIGGVQEMPDDIKEKAVSAVAAMIRSAAQESGHNVELAEKMVRREIELKIDGEVISPAGQLLTLTSVEAERKVGKKKEPLLSEGTVKDIPELLDRIGLKGATVKDFEVTAVERVARFIAALAPLFLIAGLLGIYIEIKTTGFGLPGILGVICLAIFFWGHHIAGLAGMEDILVFLLGLALLIAEVVFFPSMGILGVLGAVLMLLAILNAMIQRYPGGPWLPSFEDLQWPMIKLSLSLVGTAVVAGLIGQFLPRTAVFRKLVLEQATTRQAGYAASEDTTSLVGQEGTAASSLRPAGIGIFGDRRFDVVTRGEYVQPGERIRIVESHGSRILVEACGPGPEGGKK